VTSGPSFPVFSLASAVAPPALQGPAAAPSRNALVSFDDVVKSVALPRQSEPKGPQIPKPAKPAARTLLPVLLKGDTVPVHNRQPRAPETGGWKHEANPDIPLPPDLKKIKIPEEITKKGRSTHAAPAKSLPLDAAPKEKGFVVAVALPQVTEHTPLPRLVRKPATEDSTTERKAVTSTPEPARDSTPEILASPAALEVRLRVAPDSVKRSAGFPDKPLPVAKESKNDTADKPEKEPNQPRVEVEPAPLLQKAHQPATQVQPSTRGSHSAGPETVAHPQTEVTHARSSAVPPATSDNFIKPALPQQATPRAEVKDTPAPSHAQELLPERPETPQPLRNVSLEFTPDGASDVRLRVSERSGEVHISLHSSDPSLSGRLHEGIHDLVGSLSSAGYDAEAWTSDQGRQNQRQREDADESPKKRHGDSSGTGRAEVFSSILQQPIREVI